MIKAYFCNHEIREVLGYSQDGFARIVTDNSGPDGISVPVTEIELAEAAE